MDQEIFEQFVTKNKAFISSIEANKVPCPTCFVNTQDFFEQRQGLENHYRICHKGVYNERTIDDARKLRRRLHFDNLSNYIDAWYETAQNTEADTNLTLYRVKHKHLNKRIFASSPERAVKIFGHLLYALGLVPKFTEGSKDNLCTIDVENEHCKMQYEIWIKYESSPTGNFPRILSFCTFVQRSDLLYNAENPSNFEDTTNETELDGINTDTDDVLIQVLKNIFKLNKFRPQQREIIETVLKGKNVMTIMPTGGGKSLCFMLPAYISQGVTVVVVPYNSLMYDIHRRLTHYNILSGHVNQFTPTDDLDNIIHDLNSQKPKYKVLISTPESLQRPNLKASLQNLHSRNLLHRFVIDEVHCMNEASHQFRPEYLKLNELQELYPGVQIVGLTATASPDTLDRIVKHLGIENNFELFQSPVTRCNIEYKVERKKKADDIHDSIKTFIVQSYPVSPGIVYCNTPEDVLTIAYQLENGDNKLSVAKYSGGGLDETQKQKDLQDWLDGKKVILVATKAAGTGIDKPDVRFVVHVAMPDSIEEYYQQSGRCGRDGLPATALMYYRTSDRGLHIKHIAEKDSAQACSIGIRRLICIEEYAYSQKCRKSIISEYFGENPSQTSCNMCDNCHSPPACDDIEIGETAKNIVNLVLSVGNKLGEKQVTPAIVAAAYRGANTTATRKHGIQECVHFGAGKGQYSDQSARDLIRFLTANDVLKEDMKPNENGKKSVGSYVALGIKSDIALKGDITLIFKRRK